MNFKPTKIPTIAPMALKTIEEIERKPAPQIPGMYAPTKEPTNIKKYTIIFEDIAYFIPFDKSSKIVFIS